MIKNMAFVYSLSCDNVVFYIGISNNLASRYVAHMNSHKAAKQSPVARHIGLLVSNQKQIKLTIIYYLPREEAIKKEAEIIYMFTKAGHHILNEQHTLFRYKHKNNDCKSFKETINYLKYKQYVYEDSYCCSNNLDYEQTTGNKRYDTYSRLRKNLLQSKGLPSDSTIYI